MTIREVKIDDLKPLADLVLGMMDYHRSIDPNYKDAKEFGDIEAHIKDWLSDRSIKIFVAEDGGQICGYLRASINRAPEYSKDSLYGMIDDVFVDVKNRRSGTAATLFEAAKSWFMKRNLYRVELNAHIKNPSAIALWKKLGFEDYKLRMKMDL